MAANKVHWWDAPTGYKAVKSPPTTCDACEFKKDVPPYHRCVWKRGNFGCLPEHRKDSQQVIFVCR